MTRRTLLAACLLVTLSGCSGSPQALIDTADKCPALPTDVAAEAGRKPEIRGQTGVEVAGRLVAQIHRKNAALARSAALYDACRGT